jgi:hypothetical protein
VVVQVDAYRGGAGRGSNTTAAPLSAGYQMAYPENVGQTVSLSAHTDSSRYALHPLWRRAAACLTPVVMTVFENRNRCLRCCKYRLALPRLQDSCLDLTRGSQMIIYSQ